MKKYGYCPFLILVGFGLAGCPGPSNNEDLNKDNKKTQNYHLLQTGTRPITLVDSDPTKINGGSESVPPGSTTNRAYWSGATWQISYLYTGRGATRPGTVTVTPEVYGPLIVPPSGPGPAPVPIQAVEASVVSTSVPTQIPGTNFWYGTTTINVTPKSPGGIYNRVVVEATVSISVPGITEIYTERASNNMYLRLP